MVVMEVLAAMAVQVVTTTMERVAQIRAITLAHQAIQVMAVVLVIIK